MIKHNLCPMALSLVALFACNPDKADSATEGPSTTEGSTDGTDTTATGSPTEPDITGTTTEGETEGETEGSTGGNGEAGAPCIDTPMVLTLEDETPLGTTVEKFLSDKLGARETTLTFAEEPLSLSDEWKGKQLPLAVALRHEGGEIRWIDSEIDPEWESMGTEGFPGECEDRLEVDVEFDFVTEGLEFDEHRPGTLSATTAEQATLRVKLMPPGIAGSFDETSLYGDPEWVVTGIEVGGIWQGTKAGGELLNEVLVGGEDGFAGFGNVAGWGDEIDW